MNLAHESIEALVGSQITDYELREIVISYIIQDQSSLLIGAPRQQSLSNKALAFALFHPRSFFRAYSAASLARIENRYH